MTTQSEIDTHFAELVTDGCNVPDAWLRSAERLLSAADLLMRMMKSGRELHGRQHRTESEDALASRAVQALPTALMLYGFALECLMKAHFVRENTIYANGKLQVFGEVKPSHDLVKLSRAVGLFDTFGSTQIEVLDKLTLYIEIGRYPAPFDSKRYGHLMQPDGSMKLKGIWSYHEENEILTMLMAIYGRLGVDAPVYIHALTELPRR